MMQYRKLKVPRQRDGIHYRAMCDTSGEVLEGACIEELFKIIAQSFDLALRQDDEGAPQKAGGPAEYPTWKIEVLPV